MSSLSTVLVVAMASLARAVPVGRTDVAFELWAGEFDYPLEETPVVEVEEAREVFAANQEMMAAHNARFEQGLETFTMGLNQFSHLTSTQFKAWMHNPMNRTRPRNEVTLPTNVPTSVDWREKGAVTAVKNQGQCGSCWAFSTTGSTESRVQIAGGKLEPLSEQQLMDCSTAEGDHSCQGGLMDYAFKYIIENKGVDSEADYPYQEKNEACNTAKEKHVVAELESFTDVPKSDEEQLIAAIAGGPVSVAVEADQAAWQHYASGVITGPCGDQLDHGVLAVGYTEKYIMVKNSWGSAWGMDGYIALGRGGNAPNGVCGIAMQPSYPVPKAAKAVAEE
eukprot:m.246339 g.246339  ORF g.246339 m.246339 type:complete len:336 (+) comp26424_c1_seq1:45-1052(+)